MEKETINLSDKSVLLVEDEYIIQRIFEHMAPQIGIKKFDLAKNGQEAVEMVKINLYDLILMDIKMPIMDGETAAKEIRNMKDGNHPKIIAYTAYQNFNLNGEFNGRITKPANAQAIREAILDVFEMDNPIEESE